MRFYFFCLLQALFINRVILPRVAPSNFRCTMLISRPVFVRINCFCIRSISFFGIRFRSGLLRNHNTMEIIFTLSLYPANLPVRVHSSALESPTCTYCDVWSGFLQWCWRVLVQEPAGDLKWRPTQSDGLKGQGIDGGVSVSLHTFQLSAALLKACSVSCKVF